MSDVWVVDAVRTPIGRYAGAAGLPTSVTGATVNRLCGSGMEAVIQGSRAIASSDANVILAGGVESMSRAPWVLTKPAKAFPNGHETLHSTTIGWRMVNRAMPAEWTVALGEGAEILADQFSISREEQDAFALASHLKAAAAWDKGLYDDEVVLVVGPRPHHRQRPRPAPSPSVTRWAAPTPAASAHWPTSYTVVAVAWGLAAICIGVGQGLAVVLKA